MFFRLTVRVLVAPVVWVMPEIVVFIVSSTVRLVVPTTLISKVVVVIKVVADSVVVVVLLTPIPMKPRKINKVRKFPSNFFTTLPLNSLNADNLRLIGMKIEN